MHNPSCSATQTSYNIEISLVASLDIILSSTRITKALIRLCGCAGLFSLKLQTLQTQMKCHMCGIPSGSAMFAKVPAYQDLEWKGFNHRKANWT